MRTKWKIKKTVLPCQTHLRSQGQKNLLSSIAQLEGLGIVQGISPFFKALQKGKNKKWANVKKAHFLNRYAQTNTGNEQGFSSSCMGAGAWVKATLWRIFGLLLTNVFWPDPRTVSIFVSLFDGCPIWTVAECETTVPIFYCWAKARSWSLQNKRCFRS